MSLAASRLSQPLPHLSGSIIYCREKPENKADETQKPEYSPLLHNVACGFTALRFSCPELSGSAAVISPLPLSTQNNHRSSRKTLWQTHPKPSTLTPSPLLTFHHGRNEGIIAHILVAPTRERGAPAPHILLLYPHKRTPPPVFFPYSLTSLFLYKANDAFKSRRDDISVALEKNIRCI